MITTGIMKIKAFKIICKKDLTLFINFISASCLSDFASTVLDAVISAVAMVLSLYVNSIVPILSPPFIGAYIFLSLLSLL